MQSEMKSFREISGEGRRGRIRIYAVVHAKEICKPDSLEAVEAIAHNLILISDSLCFITATETTTHELEIQNSNENLIRLSEWLRVTELRIGLWMERLSSISFELWQRPFRLALCFPFAPCNLS